METIVDALKNLYAAFGGDVDDVENVENIANMINALADYIGEGGAAELPTVTTADNGKVLTVVTGEWKAATLPNSNTTT